MQPAELCRDLQIMPFSAGGGGLDFANNYLGEARLSLQGSNKTAAEQSKTPLVAMSDKQEKLLGLTPSLGCFKSS